MEIWSLFQIAINIVLGLGLVVVWAKMKRPPQDDPRLSRGLQLLQSKISVLEDLSDRTDKQVEQLSQLMEQKTRQLQTKIFESEKQLQKVDHSMHRSLEVAEIFQDKIPHTEIIERQNTVKYVLAAQLAHKGHSINEILEKVDLPREQIEFIVKVNKDELMFDAEQLPAWAKTQIDRITEDEIEEQEELEAMMTKETFAGLSGNYDHHGDDLDDWNVNSNINGDIDLAQPELSNLRKLGEEFRQACVDFDEKQHNFDEEERRLQEAPAKIAHAAHHFGERLTETIAAQTEKIAAQTEKLGHKISEKIPEKLGERITEKLSHKISEKLQGTVAEKIGRKVMASSNELLHHTSSQEAKPHSGIIPGGSLPQAAAAGRALDHANIPNTPAAGRFLPIQPEAVADSRANRQPAKPIGKTKVHSASQFEESSKMRVTEVPNNEIKKVLFPRIDLDDQLG